MLSILVSCAWWDWPLTWLTDSRHSVLWHCWLGHLTCEIVPLMPCNVPSGMLNSTVPYIWNVPSFTWWRHFFYQPSLCVVFLHYCHSDLHILVIVIIIIIFFKFLNRYLIQNFLFPLVVWFCWCLLSFEWPVVAGVLGYYLAQLNDMIQYPDLRTEVFQSFREIGNAVLFCLLVEQSLVCSTCCCVV